MRERRDPDTVNVSAVRLSRKAGKPGEGDRRLTIVAYQFRILTTFAPVYILLLCPGPNV